MVKSFYSSHSLTLSCPRRPTRDEFGKDPGGTGLIDREIPEVQTPGPTRRDVMATLVSTVLSISFLIPEPFVQFYSSTWMKFRSTLH